MHKRIIDLRDAPLPKLHDVAQHDTSKTPLWRTRLQHRQEHAPENSGTQLRERERFLPLIEWTAQEYAARERGPYWWLAPSAVALAAVLFAILVRSYVFAAFAALALIVVLLYARRPPREYRFAISREGVYIGERRHQFSELQSFWIFTHEQGPELSLETKTGRIFPYLYLPLGDAHPNRVRRVLSDFLPEKEHQELFTDQIARSIGF